MLVIVEVILWALVASGCICSQSTFGGERMATSGESWGRISPAPHHSIIEIVGRRDATPLFCARYNHTAPYCQFIG